MKSNLKAVLKAEQECISTCYGALQKLADFHWKPTSHDSVAEKNAERAIARVWNYLADLLQP